MPNIYLHKKAPASPRRCPGDPSPRLMRVLKMPGAVGPSTSLWPLHASWKQCRLWDLPGQAGGRERARQRNWGLRGANRGLISAESCCSNLPTRSEVSCQNTPFLPSRQWNHRSTAGGRLWVRWRFGESSGDNKSCRPNAVALCPRKVPIRRCQAYCRRLS